MIILSAFLTLLLSGVLILYFNLGVIFNVDHLKKGLDKFEIFKNYSWETGDITWLNEGLFSKHLIIKFKNFCFDYQKSDLSAKGCFTKFSFETELSLFPPFIHHRLPFTAESELIEVFKGENKEENQSEPLEIDVQKYYSYLWNRYVPDLAIKLEKIDLHLPDKALSFPLKVSKSKDHLNLISRTINLLADRKEVSVFLDENFPLPLKDYQFEVKKALLKFSIDKHIGISFSSLLEFIDLRFSSNIPSMIDTGKIDEVVGNFLKNFKLDIHAPRVQHHLQTLLKPPYNTLPAPLNEMEGDVSFHLAFTPLENSLYQGNGELKVDFKSDHQRLNLSLLPQVKVSAIDFSYSDILLNLDFHDVLLELPRLSKRSLPPQLVPDSRFKSSKAVTAEKKTEPPVLLDLNIKGVEESSLHLRTDLIDEDIRLNFHFDIKNNELVDGHIRLLPLKLKILKRPIAIDRLWLKFSKVSTPTLNSIIWFNLPEYKIKLLLEGPVSSPRYVFSSEPPLPLSDIYSVLLFGRPLQDMGGENTAVAQQTTQMISQGLLSLSVLYILSGTPIEYIGYDAKTKEATAQVGLGDKNSLRFSAGEEGRTTGVRRSLGKGWYLDTSVQTPSGASNQKSQDYGLFLERIIAY